MSYEKHMQNSALGMGASVRVVCEKGREVVG